MRALAVDGADLVVVPQAGAAGEWPEGLYEAEMRVAAFQNGYFVALCNRVGREDQPRLRRRVVRVRARRRRDRPCPPGDGRDSLRRHRPARRGAVARPAAVPEAPPARVVRILVVALTPRVSRWWSRARTNRSNSHSCRSRLEYGPGRVAARGDALLRSLRDGPVLAVGAVPELDRVVDRRSRACAISSGWKCHSPTSRVRSGACGQMVIVSM